MKYCVRVVASILAVAGFLFAPVSFGIGPQADIAPTSSAVEILLQGGLGSGVYVGNNEVVTARHVVADAHGSWMIVRDQAGEQIYVTAIKWVSKTTDVAVIKIASPLKFAAVATLDKRAPVVGEKLEVVGCPYGHPFVHTLGQVTSSKTLNFGDWRDAIQINAEVHPGNSGGPAFDRDGKVLGIVVGALLDANHRPIVNIMISSREIVL